MKNLTLFSCLFLRYVPTVASELKTKFLHGDYKVGEICDCLTLEQHEQDPVCNWQDE